MKDVMVIKGGNRLFGEIKVQGAKNSVLPILAATVISGKTSEIQCGVSAVFRALYCQYPCQEQTGFIRKYYGKSSVN